MRNIQLVLNARHNPEEHEKYLRSFVKTMNAHDEDESGKLALKRLEIRLWSPEMNEPYDRLSTLTRNDLDRNMYILENLIDLPKIDSVEISGIPVWLSQCLKTCIEGGHGSAVSKLCWPMKTVKRTKTRAAYQRSVRLTIEPILDWTEYAEEHGIALPQRYRVFCTNHNFAYARPTFVRRPVAAAREQV
jgi:hypothetical protein